MIRAALLIFLCASATLLSGCESLHADGDSQTRSHMSKDVIATDAAPAAIGPYSQAIGAGNLVFCSGQIALDPKSGEMVGATAAEQAEQALRNLSAVLEAAGSSMGQVVCTTVFLVDMADYASVNEVYARHFGDNEPARAAVAVKQLPKGALVEVDCFAIR